MNTSNRPEYIAKNNRVVFVLISETATTYTFEAKEQPEGMAGFEFTVPKNDAEEKGKINPGKVFIWLMKKVKEAICPECE